MKVCGDPLSILNQDYPSSSPWAVWALGYKYGLTQISYTYLQHYEIFFDFLCVWNVIKWFLSVNIVTHQVALQYHTKLSVHTHFLFGWMTTLEPQIGLNLLTVLMVTLKKRLLVPLKSQLKKCMRSSKMECYGDPLWPGSKRISISG